MTAFEAGSYVIQAFAESRAVGIERFIFFRTHDADMSQYFGLIRSDSDPAARLGWAPSRQRRRTYTAKTRSQVRSRAVAYVA